jgi:diguanylate cyclase (GGDEF)-like protein
MFYFGALLTIIILNVFLSIRLQESIYAYYASYVSSFSLFILVFSGLDFYIGLGKVHYLLHFAPSAVMLFLTLFSLKFLDAKKYAPKLYRILLSLSIAFAVLIILIAINVTPWYMVMNNLSSVTFALLIATALYIAKQNNPNAKYYLMIMIPTVFSLAFLSLMFTGDIENTDFYRYSFLVASLLEIGLFALILANRFFQTRELANRDALTKLYNRHYFNEISSGYFENSIQRGHNLSVLMIDIDDFKQLNDTYGHAFGDKVLIRTSEHLKNFSRKGDFIVRYGGEEFLFLIYDTPIESSFAMAKRICQYIQMSKLLTPKGEDIFITISAGLSQLDVDHDKSVEDIIRRADDALYRSKKEGKNRVSLG